MNRTQYFNYIDSKLGILAYRINLRGKLNILDLHLHSETFFLHLFKVLFGWDFVSANAIKQNVEAIDLIDHKNKFICQVSATNTKQKVEAALSKPFIKKFPGYTFKFVSISKEAADLRKDTFKNPNGITFDPKTDILDNKSILDFLLIQNIDKQKEIYEFIKKELGDEVSIVKLDSNLAMLINVLSKDNSPLSTNPVTNSFEIKRKIEFNTLQTTNGMIHDFAVYGSRVDRQFQELDKLGSNKSTYVLQSINKSYLEEKVNHSGSSADNIFLQVISNVAEKVLNSANYASIPFDELEFSVSVLVVGAFIRCKIFENPVDYKYAAA
jgi:hypothetical protein